MKRETPTHREGMQGPGTHRQHSTAQAQGRSAEAQRARVLAHLRQHHRLTTIEARERLNVLHPAGRVFELRARGHRIETLWRTERDAAGNPHHVAEYVLMPGAAEVSQ